MSSTPARSVAVIGAGWAGLACAVEATRRGDRVTLFEAASVAGGRARRIDGAAGAPVLDNGQHILIGAYVETLRLMRDVGVDPDLALLRQPLSLRFADGGGLALPRWPAPLNLLAGIAGARGWNWRDKASLLRTALQWRRDGFLCDDHATVVMLCAGLTPRVMQELIEPLCISALNTPLERACGRVFLRVLQDALFGAPGGADLLLPRVDLGALLPDAALAWLTRHGAQVRLSTRVRALAPHGAPHRTQWRVDGETFDRVVLACAPWDAARLVRASGMPAEAWCAATEALRFEAIATVYLHGATRLAAPMVALRSDGSDGSGGNGGNGGRGRHAGAGSREHDNGNAPAQFAFDRGQLGGPAGLLALVVSASNAPREVLQAQVLVQAAIQLAQPGLQCVTTIVEKRATFACTPALARPPQQIAPGLQACGDYVEGPYPATLEGAIRSGLAAARARVNDVRQR